MSGRYCKRQLHCAGGASSRVLYRVSCVTHPERPAFGGGPGPRAALRRLARSALTVVHLLSFRVNLESESRVVVPRSNDMIYDPARSGLNTRFLRHQVQGN